MAENHVIPDCRVSVGGQKLAGPEKAQLAHVIVDLNADLFGQCTLLFSDPQMALINGKKFASGVAVKVEIGYASRLQKVFEGEVVALEPQFRRDLPAALRVVCHESIHRLALAQMTRSFNNVDDGEIAKKIAQEHGLTAQAPSGSKEHVLQANVTDAVFLRRLAQKRGNRLRIEGKKLIIGPPPKGATLTVAPGEGLTRLKVKISSQQQVGEISVHGWDPKTRQEIVARAKPPPGEAGEGARKHGSGRTLSFAGHEGTPRDTATAEAMAKGRLAKIAEGFVVAQGQMIGDPRVVPGTVLKFDKIAAGVDGSYRVDEARHDFSKHGYFISFKAVRVAKKQAPRPAKPAPQPQQGPPPPQQIAPQNPPASQPPAGGAGGSTGGTAPAATTGGAAAAAGPAPAAQPVQGAVTVEIKAGDGSSKAPTVVGAKGSVTLAAVPDGGADGTFAWASSSGKLTLSNTSSKTVTITAGSAPSASLGAEAVEVTFTPKAGGAPTKVVAKLSVITAEVAGSSGQSYGFDDMSGVAGAAPHVSVEQNQSTKIAVQVKGGPGGEALFFSVADSSVAEVAAPGSPGASFDLTVNGKAKNKAATKVQIKAVDASGPVLAEFEVDVYKKHRLEANVFKVQDGRSAASTLTYGSFDISNAGGIVSGWYAQAVLEMKLNDANGGTLDVAYDDDSNGYVEIEPAATSDKQRKITAALTGGGQKVVICRKLAWIFYLQSAARAGDTSVTLKSSYSGYMQFLLAGMSCKIGSGANQETVTIRRVNGAAVELNGALAHDHATTDGLLYELSGLSGNPIWVAESGKTEALIRQTIGHELGHSLVNWADLEASKNLMHYASADVHELNVKPLPKKYAAGTESQWDTVSR